MTLSFVVIAEKEDNGRVRYMIDLLEDRSPEDVIKSEEQDEGRKVVEIVSYPKDGCGREVERGSKALGSLLELTSEDYSIEFTLEHLFEEALNAGRRLERKNILAELREEVR